jgi:hypothetical protein
VIVPPGIEYGHKNLFFAVKVNVVGRCPETGPSLGSTYVSSVKNTIPHSVGLGTWSSLASITHPHYSFTSVLSTEYFVVLQAKPLRLTLQLLVIPVLAL